MLRRTSCSLFALSIALLAACSSSSDTTPPDSPDAEPVAVDAQAACFHCGAIMSNPDEFDPDNLCEASQPLFEAVIGCLCGSPEDPPSAKCGAECADSVCSGVEPSQQCGNCAAMACGPETGACLNDN